MGSPLADGPPRRVSSTGRPLMTESAAGASAAADSQATSAGGHRLNGGGGGGESPPAASPVVTSLLAVATDWQGPRSRRGHATDPRQRRRRRCCAVSIAVVLAAGVVSGLLLFRAGFFSGGPKAPPPPALPSEVPAPVLLGLATTYIGIGWQAAARTDNRTELDGYVVQMMLKAASAGRRSLNPRALAAGGAAWQQVARTSVGRRTWGEAGLLGGRQYCFRVAAVADSGAGPFSNSSCWRTDPPLPPQPPSVLSPVSTDAHTVTIKWPAANGSGRVVHGYVLQQALDPLDGDPEHWQVVYNNTGLSAAAGGLTPNSFHAFRVRSVTLLLSPTGEVQQQQHSDWSPTSRFHTNRVLPPPSVPMAPRVPSICLSSAVALRSI